MVPKVDYLNIGHSSDNERCNSAMLNLFNVLHDKWLKNRNSLNMVQLTSRLCVLFYVTRGLKSVRSFRENDQFYKH